jgi:creatinine amidohydrolase/Fe(II)-dependent formamide hydrolase-like protein
MFAGGVQSISANGAIGDPSRASAEQGERYWTVALELATDATITAPHRPQRVQRSVPSVSDKP